jgi:DNA-binding MarR family transcriptional regulator
VGTFESGTGSLAQRVAVGLNKIGIAIRSRAWKAAAVQQITPLQAQTLSIFGVTKKRAMTISAIAEELAVSLPTASEVVRTLERKGWVQKKRSSADGRVVTVRLTAKGKRKIERTAGPPDFLAAVIVRLPRSEQKALLRLLIKIMHNLQNHERSRFVPRVARHAFRPRPHKSVATRRQYLFAHPSV